MAKIRIEWLQLSNIDTNEILYIIGTAENLTANTSTTTLSSIRPNGTDISARVTAIDDAIVVSTGINPTITESTGVRIEAGETTLFRVLPGYQLAFRESITDSLSTGATYYTNNTTTINQTLGTATDRSTSIIAGNTAQILANANASRRSLTGQKISADDIWCSETATSANQVGIALLGCYRVSPNTTVDINSSGQIWIFGANTGQKFTATEVS